MSPGPNYSAPAAASSSCGLNAKPPCGFAAIFVCAGLGVVPFLAFAAAPSPPPNVVLIVCDNLGNGDVGCDVKEEQEVSSRQPEVGRRLLAMAAITRTELGDGPHAGRGQRPAGQAANPTPRK